MTCNCLTMCRIPDVETLGGRYPMPKHAPNCNEFKQEEFTKLECCHGSFILDTNEAQAILDDADEEYVVSTVLLTRDQFDNMKEFTGF